MKTTLDIEDELLVRAKRHAELTGRSLSAVVEDGLRLLLNAGDSRQQYRLPDLSFGGPEIRNPLASYSWPELREIIYDEWPGR